MAPSFAPGCCDPRAAYAVGMMVKMLKTQASSPPSLTSKLTANGDKSSQELRAAGGGANEASPVIWQVKLEKLQRVLESPQVQAQDKQGLVDMIEDAVSVQDVWTYLDGVGGCDVAPAFVPSNSSSISISALEKRASELSLNGAQQAATAVDIPMELGCAICCSDLMLKPVSLACGHSFCKYCLELWLANRSNCPSCRQSTASASSDSSNSHHKQQQLSVNLALQHVIATFYPAQLEELEKQSQTERFEQLRCAIREALCSSDGEDLREILARLPRNNTSANSSSNYQDQSLAVSLILESDVELQERVLAAEIHERLRKERLLRESSRRRHMAAYNATGLSTQVDPAILSMSNNSTTTVRRGAGSHNSFGKSSSSSHGSSGNSLLTTFLRKS